MRPAKVPPRATSTHIFFYGHDGPEPGMTFSQWYPSPFTHEDKAFPTAERKRHICHHSPELPLQTYVDRQADY